MGTLISGKFASADAITAAVEANCAKHSTMRIVGGIKLISLRSAKAKISAGAIQLECTNSWSS